MYMHAKHGERPCRTLRADPEVTHALTVLSVSIIICIVRICMFIIMRIHIHTDIHTRRHIHTFNIIMIVNINLLNDNDRSNPDTGR